jgi:hypothetical protein
VGWIVALQAGLAGLGGLLAGHRAGSLAFQTLAAEWGAGRLGVAWSDPEAPPPSARAVALRAFDGALLGLGAGAIALTFAALTHAVRFAMSVSLTELGLGVVLAALVALKDELVLRGLVLRAFRHTLPPGLRVLVCGAVAAAAKLGQADPPVRLDLASGTLGSLLIAGLLAVCYATLWLRERGAWTAWAAHTTWALVTTTAVSGGIVDGYWAPTPWGGGTKGVEGSLAVVLGLGAVTAAAVATWYPTRARTG